MAKIGLGYGSEFHLLRFLGRHRNQLDKQILDLLNESNTSIDWLDFNFNANADIPDKEFIGIEFLQNRKDYTKLKQSWKGFWPSPNNAQNWDAICRIQNKWILIEAKANEQEISSTCSASPKSQKFISNQFDTIKKNYNISKNADWIRGYYQKANRILFLEYLRHNGIEANLLFIYFINGFMKDGIQLGVNSTNDWNLIINRQDKHLGIDNCGALKKDLFNLIIDVDK
jgi:hypothetical protein